MTEAVPLFGESAEMYLKTIAELTSIDELTPISQVADRLDVSPVSATEMIHRLQERELVEHIPYRGVHLTDSGSHRAAAVIRRHRLWEVFLAKKLGIAWSRVHGLACRLEHASEGVLTEKLADYLGDPRCCPHGNLIPAASGAPPEPDPAAIRLAEIGLGDSARVLRIHPESDVLLEYFERRRLLPGSAIRMVDRAILDGPLSVEVDGGLEVIGRSAAGYVFVVRTVKT